MAELEKSEIVARIKQARKEAGLSQAQLADVLNVTPRRYQNYEYDRVPYKLLGQIGDATGRSTRWLLHGEEEPAAGGADLQREINTMRGEIADLTARVEMLLDAQGLNLESVEEEFRKLDGNTRSESEAGDDDQAAEDR